MNNALGIVKKRDEVRILRKQFTKNNSYQLYLVKRLLLASHCVLRVEGEEHVGI